MTSRLKNATAAYTLSAIAYGSIYAYPVSDGGVGNLSTFLAFSSVLCVALMLTIAIFISPDKWRGDPAPVVAKWIFRTLSYGAVVWLAYHGAFAMAFVMAYNVIVSAGLRVAARAHQEEA